MSTTNTTPRFNSTAEVLKKLRDLGLPSGKTFLYKAISEGDFPAPIKVGGQNYWSDAVLAAHVDSLVAKSAATTLGESAV